jgi:hypothetical protein
MNNQELKNMQTALAEMKTQLEKTRDSLVEIGQIAYYLDTKLNAQTHNVKEFSLNEISTSLNEFVHEFIDNHIDSIPEADNLGEIDVETNYQSIEISFRVESHKIEQLISDALESFLCEWQYKIEEEKQSSTDEA